LASSASEYGKVIQTGSVKALQGKLYRGGNPTEEQKFLKDVPCTPLSDQKTD
jgi:hypothetical protein